MTFADAFDVAYAIKRDVQIMMDTQIELSMMTDSLSPFEVSANSTMATEKRLMIDLQAIKDPFENWS